MCHSVKKYLKGIIRDWLTYQYHHIRNYKHSTNPQSINKSQNPTTAGIFRSVWMLHIRATCTCTHLLSRNRYGCSEYSPLYDFITFGSCQTSIVSVIITIHLVIDQTNETISAPLSCIYSNIQINNAKKLCIL